MKILSFSLVEVVLICNIIQLIEFFEEYPSCFHTYFHRDVVLKLFLYAATYIVFTGRISSHSFEIRNVCQL